MRIVTIDSGYHAQRYCHDALAALGHDARVIEMCPDERTSAWLARLLRTIAADKPAAILSVNWICFDRAGLLARALRAIKVEAYVWAIDDPRRILGEVPVPDCVTHLACWEREYVPALAPVCATARHLPLAAAPWAIEHEADVTRWPEDTALVGTWSIERDRLVRRLGPGTHVWGDDRWRGVPCHWRGPVRYGPALSEIYTQYIIQDARRPECGPTASNQRAYDVPACGGVLLCDALGGDVYELGYHDNMTRRQALLWAREQTYTARMRDWIGAP
jgi:hypothetical protein